MRHLKTLLLLVAFASLSLHCKKEEPASELSKLPPITNYGAQTYGCLINGKAWYVDPVYITVDYLNNYLTVWADDGLFSVKFALDGKYLNKPGNYLIPVNSLNNFKNSFFVGIGQKYYYSTDPVNHDLLAQITITRLDTVNFYAAGTFSFGLFDKTGENYVSVTNGRFDNHYH